VQRHLRLRGRTAFQRLRTDGQVKKNRDLMVSYVPNTLPHNRYGIIVVKHIGKAVTRNRLRRRLRGCLQNVDAALLGGYDIVIITRGKSADLKQVELCAALTDVLQRAKLLPETL